MNQYLHIFNGTTHYPWIFKNRTQTHSKLMCVDVPAGTAYRKGQGLWEQEPSGGAMDGHPEPCARTCFQQPTQGLGLLSSSTQGLCECLNPCRCQGQVQSSYGRDREFRKVLFPNPVIILSVITVTRFGALTALSSTKLFTITLWNITDFISIPSFWGPVFKSQLNKGQKSAWSPSLCP